MLPSIKIALPVLFLLWCVVGVWRMGGPVMLAYPAMWGAVVGLFLLASTLLGKPAPPADAG